MPLAFRLLYGGLGNVAQILCGVGCAILFGKRHHGIPESQLSFDGVKYWISYVQCLEPHKPCEAGQMKFLQLWLLACVAGMILTGLVTDLMAGHYLTNFYRPSVPDFLTSCIAGLMLATIISLREKKHVR